MYQVAHIERLCTKDPGRHRQHVHEIAQLIEPVGLLMCGILHYILDEENPAEIVRTLYRTLPPGSYVFIHHLLDMEDPAAATLQDQMRGGWGARSSGHEPRSWSSSTAWSWSSPAWCSGGPVEVGRRLPGSPGAGDVSHRPDISGPR